VKSLLIVEDHDSFARLMEVVLQHRGYGVKIVPSLEEALAALKEKPDMLLLDLHSSDAGANETIAAIPDIIDQVPVVITSHIDDPDKIKQVLATGAKYANKGSPEGPLSSIVKVIES
jgi:DNA-binding response OmpR family regulator